MHLVPMQFSVHKYYLYGIIMPTADNSWFVAELSGQNCIVYVNTNVNSSVNIEMLAICLQLQKSIV